jgi:thiamine transport system ATP-binding protein
MSGLEVRNVTVVYQGNPAIVALDRANLSVATGEVVGLLGSSGSGKSSLLGAIVGFVPLESGAILWDGIDVTHTPIHERGFGLVFQDGQLFPHRSVAGNVSFGLEMARVPVLERDRRVEEALALVGLSGFEARPIDELSGGEQQRVALARSLAPRPRLLLLDEPLSSLDRDLRDRLAIDVREILHSTKTTSIIVTHDPDEAAVMCSRIVRIESGRIA